MFYNFGYIPVREKSGGFRDSVYKTYTRSARARARARSVLRFHLSFKRIRVQVEPSDRAQ